jgi:hypothetical protein
MPALIRRVCFFEKQEDSPMTKRKPTDAEAERVKIKTVIQKEFLRMHPDYDRNSPTLAADASAWAATTIVKV